MEEKGYLVTNLSVFKINNITITWANQASYQRDDKVCDWCGFGCEGQYRRKQSIKVIIRMWEQLFRKYFVIIIVIHILLLTNIEDAKCSF